MPEIQRTIAYAGRSISFHLDRANRKSLEIAVHPDGSVVVKAPADADEDLILRHIRGRARWILRQLRYFAQFDPRTPKRRFVGGESHLYLGKKYRLKIRESNTDGVLLKQGFFHITAVDSGPGRVAALLKDWYRCRAEIYFSQVLDKCWRRFQKRELDKPRLKIRTMKTRWGSFSRKNGITLNLELIKAPRECIEYVVIHELCHLFHPDHGAKFYDLLVSLLPDWAERKRKLEVTLS